MAINCSESIEYWIQVFSIFAYILLVWITTFHKWVPWVNGEIINRCRSKCFCSPVFSIFPLLEGYDFRIGSLDKRGDNLYLLYFFILLLRFFINCCNCFKQQLSLMCSLHMMRGMISLDSLLKSKQKSSLSKWEWNNKQGENR